MILRCFSCAMMMNIGAWPFYSLVQKLAANHLTAYKWPFCAWVGGKSIFQELAMRNPRDCRETKVKRPRAQTCCTFQIQTREMAWELTFFQPGLCPLKQTDKKSHCSAHSQSCCFTPLLARINKNVGWKRDFLVAVEKPWPKCCTLEASNNLYWQQESKMENVVLIPPSLSLSCFLMHGYVFFFFTLYVLRMLSCDCECLISVWHTADETEQSRKWHMSKWPNSRRSHRKKKQKPSGVPGLCLTDLFSVFVWMIYSYKWLK